MRKWLVALLVIAVAAAALVLRVLTSGAIGPADEQRPPPLPPPSQSKPQPLRTVASCAVPDSFRAAAVTNAGSLSTLEWAPFGRDETGWQIYVPAIQTEIGTDCPPDSPGFAAALADWQKAEPRQLYPTGVFGDVSFQQMRTAWMLRRPFVRASQNGAACPAAPPEFALTPARPQEGYSGKLVLLKPGALAAYRRMVEAARREVPGLAKDGLAIFSGFRSPEADAARCAAEQNCGGPARANCSAHRTGLAMDLYLGAAPGFRPESSDDENRLYQSRTPAYRWLVRNAARFGFVGYPFEPWHWEWTGEAVSASAASSSPARAALSPANSRPTSASTSART